MLDYLQDAVIILAATGAALLFWWLLQRIWPKELRRQHNDLIGWQLSILGTTYAVIIGFMLYAVWTNFELADVNAGNEANNLVNLYRMADGMPPAQRAKVQELSKEYVDAVLKYDWPNMDKASQDFAESHKVLSSLWSDLLPVEADTSSYSILYDHALTELAALTECRRLRELESASALPGILWVVLIAGAGITIMSSCMFGAENSLLHALQVVSLTVLLTLVLVAVSDINRPFQGQVHVEPRGFIQAWATMHEGQVYR